MRGRGAEEESGWDKEARRDGMASRFALLRASSSAIRVLLGSNLG
jgi:hypothetical protein